MTASAAVCKRATAEVGGRRKRQMLVHANTDSDGDSGARATTTTLELPTRVLNRIMLNLPRAFLLHNVRRVNRTCRLLCSMMQFWARWFEYNYGARIFAVLRPADTVCGLHADFDALEASTVCLQISWAAFVRAMQQRTGHTGAHTLVVYERSNTRLESFIVRCLWSLGSAYWVTFSHSPCALSCPHGVVRWGCCMSVPEFEQARTMFEYVGMQSRKTHVPVIDIPGLPQRRFNDWNLQWSSVPLCLHQ
jgi:hypothetical protein